MMVEKQRVLLTGASGFIGRYLSEVLHADDRYELVVAGRRRPDMISNQDVEFYDVGEINEDTDWQESLRGVYCVIHLAGLAHVSDPGVDAGLAFESVNTRGTDRLASQAVEAGVTQFVFLSSIGVNGNASRRPFTVGDVPSPKELYAESKLRAEARLKAVADKSSMVYTIIRPPLVYGPGAPGNFGLLCSVVEKGLPLPLRNTGNLRSFVSVWNLCDLVVHCLGHEQAANQIFLVRDGHDVSTSGFLKSIGEASGRKVTLFWVPPILLKLGASMVGKRGIYDRLFDSLQIEDDYTRRLLGWEAPLSLEESLEKCFSK